MTKLEGFLMERRHKGEGWEGASIMEGKDEKVGRSVQWIDVQMTKVGRVLSWIEGTDDKVGGVVRAVSAINGTADKQGMLYQPLTAG